MRIMRSYLLQGAAQRNGKRRNLASATISRIAKDHLPAPIGKHHRTNLYDARATHIISFT